MYTSYNGWSDHRKRVNNKKTSIHHTEKEPKNKTWLLANGEQGPKPFSSPVYGEEDRLRPIFRFFAFKNDAEKPCWGCVRRMLRKHSHFNPNVAAAQQRNNYIRLMSWHFINSRLLFVLFCFSLDCFPDNVHTVWVGQRLGVNLFSTAVPFWGQITWSLSDFVPKTGLRFERGQVVTVSTKCFTIVWRFFIFFIFIRPYS